MKNQISIINLSQENASNIKIMNTHSGWQVLPKGNMPKFFPHDFAEKLDSVIAITAPF